MTDAFAEYSWLFNRKVSGSTGKERIDELVFSSPYKFAPAELDQDATAKAKEWLETDEREPLDKDLKELLAQNFVYAIPARKACS
jgi:hypothetical protein